MTSSSNSGIENQFHVPFVADIEGLIFSVNHTYVPEPPMKIEKSLIWASRVLIPFSIASDTQEFLGPLPISYVKTYRLKDIFLCLPLCKSYAFEYKSFELGFMEQPNRAFRYSPSTNSETYTNWLNKVEKYGKIKAFST